MNLADASQYFDKELVYDAYTSELLFKCQLSSFDDSSSSGATSRRRVLSVAPSTVLPTRKAITILGTTWVGGNGDADGFFGEPVRANFNLKRSTGLISVLTPAEACGGLLGVPSHAHMKHFKETVDTQTSSEYSNFWYVFFPTSEAAVTGRFLRAGLTLYRVRNHWESEDGFLVAEADQLTTDALKTVVFITQGSYNVIADTYPVVNVTVQAIAMAIPKFYRLEDAAEDYEKAGDISLFVPKLSVTPTKGATVMIDGEDWRVISLVDEKDAWAMHMRRA